MAAQLAQSLASAPLDRFHWAYQLSCSTDRTIKLLGSLLWPVLSLEEVKTSAVAVKVSKSWHNSTTMVQTKNLPDLIVIKCRFLLALQTSTQLSAVTEIRHPDTHTNKQTNERTDYRMSWGLHPPRHNNRNSNLQYRPTLPST